MAHKPVSHPGIYLLRPYEWRLGKKTGELTVTLHVRWMVLEERPPEEPVIDMRGELYEVGGSINIIKKDGSDNEQAQETLIRVMDWDGEWETFEPDENNQPRWKPPDCQAHVEEDTYLQREGEPAPLRVNTFTIKPASGQPLGLAACTMNELKQTHGERLKAKARALREGTPMPPPPPAIPPGVIPPSDDQIPF